MKLSVQVTINLDRAAIRRRLEEIRGSLVQSVAKQGAEHARYFAPYDTGNLESSIEAEYIDPNTWGVYARTEYALIQELRQPYLYSGVIHAMNDLPRMISESF